MLKNFSPLSSSGTNSDGAYPASENLLVSGSTLFGTTRGGGSGAGTVFKINTDGSGFTVLKYFSPMSSGTNTDGASPFAGLTLSGNLLYGTTYQGGMYGSGVVFSLSVPPPPPQLTIVSDGSGGYFINAQGQSNFTCQLQRASTITGPWSTSASQTADTNGLVQFHDLFPPSGRAFYRTVQQ